VIVKKSWEGMEGGVFVSDLEESLLGWVVVSRK